eukprot:scaffold43813_cov18-Tisochrysis_lutea.AAC.2
MIDDLASPRHSSFRPSSASGWRSSSSVWPICGCSVVAQATNAAWTSGEDWMSSAAMRSIACRATGEATVTM